MTTQTRDQAERALDMRPGARGRKDNSGQEVEPDASKVAAKIDELVEAKRKAESASEAYSKKIKAIAKDAGMNAAAVRKIVDAKSGENYEAQKRYAAQLHLLFEEIGEED